MSSRWPEVHRGSGVFLSRVHLIPRLIVPFTACGFSRLDPICYGRRYPKGFPHEAKKVGSMSQLRGVDGWRSEEKLSPVSDCTDLYKYRPQLACLLNRSIMSLVRNNFIIQIPSLWHIFCKRVY